MMARNSHVPTGIRKLLSSVLIFGLVLLCACSVNAVQEPVEMTLMHGWGGNLNTHRLMQEIYAEFDAQNPDIILNTIAYADSSIVVDKASDMLAVGKMPDIVSTNGYGFYVMNAAKRNMAMDLMPFIESDAALKEQIHPAVFAVWETGTGKLYTVPDALEMAGFWINTSYFTGAEIELPFLNWSDFTAKCTALATYLEETQFGALCYLEKNQLEEFLFLARLAGEGEAGRRLAENAYASFDKKTLLPVLQDLSVLTELSISVDTIETARQQFKNGKSALYFNGVWESEYLTDSAFVEDFVYAPYPTGTGETLAYTSASSGYVFAVQSDPRKEEAALRFLKYMLSDEVQKKIATTTGQAPCNPKISVDEIEKQKPLLAKGIRVVRDADIQISTIRSVWPESKFLLIADMLEKRKFSEEDLDSLVKKWKRE